MKFIFKAIIALVILCSIAFAVGVYYLDSIAKKAIEFGGTEALGLTTSLDEINIALLDGRTTIKNLHIANVKGFDADSLMKLGSGTVAVNLQSLAEEIIVIPEISFSDLTLNVEQKDRKSNVGTLIQQISADKSTKAPGAAASTPQDENTAPAKQFIVERVVLNNINVNAKISAMNNVITDTRVTIPSIQLTNIGKSANGLPMKEIIRELVNAILNASINNSGALSSSLSGLLDGKNINLDNLKQNLSDQIRQKAGAEADKAGQKLLNDMKLPQGSDELLKQQTDEAVNKLKGLLNSEG